MRKFFLCAVILLTVIFSVASAKVSGTWRLDGNASAELRNFRMMSDDWQIDARGKVLAA